MALSCAYIPALDRFTVSKNGNIIESNLVEQSPFYSSLEYLRYLPFDGISLKDVDEYLKRYPRELCCEITNACNLNCRFCIANAPAYHPTNISSARFVSLIRGLPYPLSRITLSGGEPTIHPDLMKIVALCTTLEAGIVLSTNGYESQSVNGVLDSGYIDLLTVSLHGPRDVHDNFVGCSGSYNRALETVKLAIEKCIPIHVISVASQETIATLPNICSTLSQLPINEHRINLVKPVGRASADAVSYEAVVESIRDISVSHKMSVKRRDQPYLLITCQGNLEVRHGRMY